MTIVFLALLTLVEGIRRVPRGAVVLQRVLFGPWRAEPPEAGDRLRLLSWWSPLTSTVLLTPREQYARNDAAVIEQLYTPLFDLRLMGLVELFVLVLGVPFALQRFGATGFFAALGAVMLLCITIFAALAFTQRGLGKPWRAALRWAFPFLSPFAAPRAAEALLEHALRDVPPAVASKALLAPDAFLLWVRPFFYDGDRHALQGLNLKELEATLAQARPASGAGLWCPRCGATYVHGDVCSECGIALVH